MNKKSVFFLESSGSPPSEVYAQQKIVFQRVWDFGFRYIQTISRDRLDLAEAEVVFLPGYVAGSIKDEELLLLGDWVKQGGNLILEIPPFPFDDMLKELIGIQYATQRRAILPNKEGPLDLKSFWLRICLPRKTSGLFRGKQHSLLLGYDLGLSLNPIWGEVLLSKPLPAAETLAEILDCDGTTVMGPGLLLNPYGKGWVFSYLFTLGHTLLCALQGRGCENLSIYDSRSGAGTASFWEPQGKRNVTRAVDQLLVGPPTWEYPFTDLLLLPIINTLLECFPELPLVYWIPEGKEAAVIHTADGDGATDDDQLAYLQEMQSRGLRTSLFFLAEQEHDARHYTLWGKSMDLGLHFSPAQWNISEQAALMRKQGFSPRSARGHSLQWQGWITTAEELVEAGVTFDSTLSIVVNSFGGKHYFSTGTPVPYRFFDVNGRMINLLEIPLPFMEFFFAEFLSRSGESDSVDAEHNSVSDYYEALKRYHAVFAVVFHPVHTHKTERWQWFKKGLEHLMNQSGFHHNNMTGYGDWFLLRDIIRVNFGSEANEVTLETPAISGLSLLSLKGGWRSKTVNLKSAGPVGCEATPGAGEIKLWGRNFQNMVADFPEGNHILCKTF